MSDASQAVEVYRTVEPVFAQTIRTILREEAPYIAQHILKALQQTGPSHPTWDDGEYAIADLLGEMFSRDELLRELRVSRSVRQAIRHDVPDREFFYQFVCTLRRRGEVDDLLFSRLLSCRERKSPQIMACRQRYRSLWAPAL